MAAMANRSTGHTVRWLLLTGALASVSRASGADAERTATAPPYTSPSGWERKVSFGSSASEGNTDRSRLQLLFLAEQRNSTNEWRICLEGVYAETDDERTTENAKGSVDYRRFIAQRTYGLARAQALYDPVAAVDYRAGAGPGIGYYLIKRPRRTLSVETGVSYLWERLDDERDHYPVARFAERFEWQVWDEMKVWQFGEYMPVIEDIDRHLATAEVGLDSMLRRRFGIQLKASLRLDSDPARGKREEDLTYSSSLTYRF